MAATRANSSASSNSPDSTMNIDALSAKSRPESSGASAIALVFGTARQQRLLLARRGDLITGRQQDRVQQNNDAAGGYCQASHDSQIGGVNRVPDPAVGAVRDNDVRQSRVVARSVTDAERGD